MNFSFFEEDSSDIAMIVQNEQDTTYEQLLMLFILVSSRRKRVFLIRSNSWYRCVNENFTENQFKETFRMSKTCFELILAKYASSLNYPEEYNKTRFEFGITLYFCSRPITYRDVANLFGISSTNTYRIINNVLGVFNNKIMPLYCRLPEADEMEAISDMFLMKSNLSGTILAVDGTHLPIEAPKTCPERYVNRKGWHSVNFQCAVDAKCVFRNIFGVFPGSCHDAYVFRRSKLKLYIESEIPAPYYVIGDAAYPIMGHLKRPFKGNLTTEQANYNYRLSAQRMSVERAFGCLKGRFKRFRYPAKNGERKPFCYQFIFACLIHNMIIEQRGMELDDFIEEFENDNQYNYDDSDELSNDDTEI